ncbi:MAG: hypothetical protein AB1449_02535 [Chloroflexota bacterium]
MGTYQQAFRPRELAFLARLDSPVRIQAFLDSIPYSSDDFNRCPQRVLRERIANCFDGALFAAAALGRLGHRPLIVDLFADDDDDHLLALFQRRGRWGAVAKSNFVGLRYREPVYRSLRELVMSYFDGYFNLNRHRTLRSYTVPLDLSQYDRWKWMGSDEALERIANRTERLRRFPLVTPHMVAGLSPVDHRSYEAGMLGVEHAGLYKPASAGRRARSAR